MILPRRYDVCAPDDRYAEDMKKRKHKKRCRRQRDATMRCNSARACAVCRGKNMLINRAPARRATKQRRKRAQDVLRSGVPGGDGAMARALLMAR